MGFSSKPPKGCPRSSTASNPTKTCPFKHKSGDTKTLKGVIICTKRLHHRWIANNITAMSSLSIVPRLVVVSPQRTTYPLNYFTSPFLKAKSLFVKNWWISKSLRKGKADIGTSRQCLSSPLCKEQTNLPYYFASMHYVQHQIKLSSLMLHANKSNILIKHDLMLGRPASRNVDKAFLNKYFKIWSANFYKERAVLSMRTVLSRTHP